MNTSVISKKFETGSKIESRLRGSASQFNALADKLLHGYNADQNTMAVAMKEAKGFNIVSSKSSKVLPLVTNKPQSYDPKVMAQTAKHSKYLNE